MFNLHHIRTVSGYFVLDTPIGVNVAAGNREVGDM